MKLSALQKKVVRSGISFFAAILVYLVLPESMPPEAKKMLAGLVCTSGLWIFEVFPLYVTSLLVVVVAPFLAIDLGELAQKPELLNTFFSPLSNPVIILFLGGFMMARALSAHRVDQFIASTVISTIAPRPAILLATVMAITSGLSMWLSNTATTVMMLAVVGPIIYQIKSDNPFRKALALSVPFAASIGGMGTPVGTPPNAIAVGLLAQSGVHLSFFQWMEGGVPLVLGISVVTFFILIRLFPSTESRFLFEFKQSERLSRPGKIALGIICGGVLLWLTTPLHHLSESWVALLCGTTLLVTGIISLKDIRELEWHIILLMWGGLALGQGMEVSGMSAWVASQAIFQSSPAVLIATFAFISTGLSTVMNDTATANLVLPIALGVPCSHAALLAFVTAVSSSIALSLPISCAPNALLFSLNIVRGREFFKAGILVTLAATTMIIGGALLAL
jgi:sodium-dependent dicarboxylate transporter 2/3/5